MGWLLHVDWWKNFSCFFFSCFYFLTGNITSSYATWATEKSASFMLSLFLLPRSLKLLPIISFRFLFLFYAIIGLSWNAIFSLGLICNKCQCSSIIFLMLVEFCWISVLVEFLVYSLIFVLKLIKLPLLLLIFC